MENRTTLSRGFVCLLAVVAITCGGDSSPTSSRPPSDARPNAPSLDLESAHLDDSADAPDTGAFSQALARLGGIHGLAHSAGPSSLSDDADWFLDIIRAPKTGQVFKVNKDGMSPQPAPKFRFKAQAPVSIPESVILVYFLTAAGKECGLATTAHPFPLVANVSRNIDIPNDYILVGPKACFLDGQKCTPTQCKFPLSTTKMRIRFGHKDQGVAEGKFTRMYRWATSTGGGSNPNPPPNNPPPNNPPPAGPTCNGASVPSNCTVGNGPPPPTARCNDGQWTCSQTSSGTCSGHGGIDCRVCPGPLCN